MKYRRPFGTQWEDLDLDTAMDMIADRVLAARRHGWQWERDGNRTRRTLGFASLGGATPGAVLRIGEVLTAGGLAGALLGRRSRVISALSGASLLAASALTRFGIFEVGMASARDPKYTIVPQRQTSRRRGGTPAVTGKE